MSDTALARVQPSSIARRDELTIEDMVAQVQKIQMLMERVMKEGEHYGVIPGTGSKPTLLKPGAEKLCTLFRLAPDPHSTDVYDGKHLTTKTKMVLTHIPSGEVWGAGEGSCSTKESKYAYRKGSRTCPKCGTEHIRKSKDSGWFCWRKLGGCGTQFKDGDQSIEGQNVDRVANEDLADQYNTVLKMANKRALVAAVLNVTAASDIFTQDLEEMAENRQAVAPVVVEATETKPVEPEVLFQTPAEENERTNLVGDMNRLMQQLKLKPAERLDFFNTYLKERTSAALAHCTPTQLTDLVNALRARAGEPKWGAAA